MAQIPVPIPIVEAQLNALTELGFTVTSLNEKTERIHYTEIAHMAVAQVSCAGTRPQTIIDLFVNQEKNRRLFRLYLDSFNPMRLVPASPSSDLALMAVIHTLHRESGAQILPNELVLQQGPRVFENMDAFEAEAYPGTAWADYQASAVRADDFSFVSET